MTRAVYRLDDKGKRVYLGHVPDEYELRDGEHFYPLNDGKKELPNDKHKNYVDYLLEKYGRRN